MVDILRSINNLVKKYDTNNPFKIARQRKIIVCFENLGCTLGYYNCYNRVQFIHINNNLDENRQIFVCAHELGHAVLHPTANTPFLKKNTFFSTDRIEVEANFFATYLLLYDKKLQDFETKSDFLRSNGVPLEMEKFI